jgi:hypothetical protein
MHFSRLKNSDEPQEYDDFYKKAMRLVVVGMNHTFEADISIMEKAQVLSVLRHVHTHQMTIHEAKKF